jgi:hypothetical protein
MVNNFTNIKKNQTTINQRKLLNTQKTSTYDTGTKMGQS